MGAWGKRSPELKEHDEVVVGGGEVTAAENSTEVACGSGGDPMSLSSRLVQIEACLSASRRRRGRRTRWTAWLGSSALMATRERFGAPASSRAATETSTGGGGGSSGGGEWMW